MSLCSIKIYCYLDQEEANNENNEEEEQEEEGEEEEEGEKEAPSSDVEDRRKNRLCRICELTGTVHASHVETMLPFFQKSHPEVTTLSREDWLCRPCYSSWHRAMYPRGKVDPFASLTIILDRSKSGDKKKKKKQITCSVCETEIQEEEEQISCTSCKKAAHPTCLSEDMMDESDEWTCDKCKKLKTSTPPIPEQTRPMIKPQSPNKPVTRFKNTYPIGSDEFMDKIYASPEKSGTKSPKKQKNK
jgi:hypothetical protein